MRLPTGIRRLGAWVLTLQMKVLAGVVGVAGMFAWLMPSFLVALYLDSNGIDGAPMAAILTVSFLVTSAIAGFMALKFVAFVDTREKNLDRAVLSAEREDRRYVEALSGGVPGQVSIVPPGAETGGELSVTAEAGSLSEAPGRKQTS